MSSSASRYCHAAEFHCLNDHLRNEMPKKIISAVRANSAITVIANGIAKMNQSLFIILCKKVNETLNKCFLFHWSTGLLCFYSLREDIRVMIYSRLCPSLRMERASEFIWMSSSMTWVCEWRTWWYRSDYFITELIHCFSLPLIDVCSHILPCGLSGTHIEKIKK